MESINISTLQNWKNKKNKFAAITAYDFSFAKLFSNQGIPIILVGDSLGMTFQGHDSTIPVTVQNIEYHTKAVRKGAPNVFLISDLPFMSYWLTPQHIDYLSGYKIQGRNEKDANKIIEEALLLEDAGIKMLVLECIPAKLSKIITEKLSIPVIGIGAGNYTDGQILVMQDLLGITEGKKLKFTKNFLSQNGSIQNAIKTYIYEVKKVKMIMRIIKTTDALYKTIQFLKKKQKKLGLVPTMGNLHKGHIKLILLAKKYADIVIVSIFVNPMQFDNLLDLKKYPQTFIEDCLVLKNEKVDILFAPKISEIYPDGLKMHTYIQVPKLSKIIEGKSRPGHFIGVTTIIGKLFNLIQPNFSFFGEKDYQQLLIVKTFVKELNYPIKIISLPTIRLKNGLAFSSRNKYLTNIELQKASFLYKIIRKTINIILKNNGKKLHQTINLAKMSLIQKGFLVDIFNVYNSQTLDDFSEKNKKNIILASVWLGSTQKNKNNEQVAIVLSAPAKITNYLVNIVEKNIKINEILDQIKFAENIFIKIIQTITKIQSCFLYEETKKIINIEFNKLKQIINDFISLKTYPENIQAIIMSRGEILSICIMKNILKSRNHKVTVINPIENIISTGSFLNSTVSINESKKRISQMTINSNNIILMPGFISGNKKGELVLLGRNGSDYSAAILACCLNAKLCEIWTDVDGVFTSDPNKISNTFLLKSISYEEAMELSYFGAKVLHPRTIKPLKKFNIPCVIKNTSNIEAKGTLICEKSNNKNILKGVTNIDDVVMFTIPGDLLKQKNHGIVHILNLLEKENINIILITQSSSKNNFSFCTLEKETQKILILLSKSFKIELKENFLNNINIIKNLSILSVIGFDISQKYDIASKIFSSLGKSKINILAIAQGSSKYSISLVIKKEKILTSMQIVHNALFHNQKTINVFLIGIGGVGKSLIKQILKQKNFLAKKNIEIKIRIIANSKKILFLDDSIDLKNWETAFKESKEKFNLEILNTVLKNNYFLNSVLIDCTSDEILSKQYVNFFSKGFHVITSSKKANTSSLKYYNEIKTTALKEDKKFLYETNVGAGLPVIQTLQNLFNTELEDIKIEPILPEYFKQCKNTEEFLYKLKEMDIPFLERIKKARDLGKVLRFVGTIEKGGKCSVKIEEIN
ncbi:Bifunctional aspartokinase/homoserine dehydrogenase, partial [Aphis craccivora]